MKQLSKTQTTILQIGCLLMIGGAATFIVGNLYSAICFAIGAVLFSAMQLAASYEGRNFIILRLHRQQLFSDVCFIICGVLMLLQALNYNRLGHNVWVITLLIGALVQLYTSFRIPAELKKEQKN